MATIATVGAGIYSNDRISAPAVATLLEKNVSDVETCIAEPDREDEHQSCEGCDAGVPQKDGYHLAIKPYLCTYLGPARYVENEQ